MAQYRFLLVARAACPSGDYRVEVEGLPNHVGKIDASTFGPPASGVALVGPLLNEPSAGSHGLWVFVGFVYLDDGFSFWVTGI